MLILFAACTPNPSDNGNAGNEGGNEEITFTSKRFEVDLSDISAIASFNFAEPTQSSFASSSFQAKARTIDVSDVISYLSGYTSDSLFSPIVFTTDAGTDILLGASRNCNNGKVEIIDTGSGTYLAIFDRLVVIDSLPILKPIRNALENIPDIMLEINAVSVSHKKNIAFIDTEAGKAYLLNPPYTLTDSDDLDFSLLHNTDDAYGYSDNRIYLLTEDKALYSFEKDIPENMKPINNSRFNPLTTNATIYTDDYAIYQYDEETLGELGKGYIEIYSAKNPKPPKPIQMSGSNDPLQNMIFRVGNNLFLRERTIGNDQEYGFTIYPLTVDDNLGLTVGEDVYYQIATDFAGDFSGGQKPKNSSVTIYGETESFLIRAENYLENPALIWLKADTDGRLSDINVIRLNRGSYFPHPISDKTAILETAMFWVGDIANGTIYMADFTSGKVRTITLNHELASDELVATQSGNIIYHGYTGNGIDVGTYEYNPETGTETIISLSTMDIHQIYEI